MSFFALFDPLYWLIIGPAMLLALWAQLKVKSSVKHWSKYATSGGYTGVNAAAAVMRAGGVNDVNIEVTKGWLSDHYDPASKTLRLSPNIYHSNSVAAVGIAAHEAGHALQHAKNYAPLHLRSAIVPMANFGSWLSWPMIIIGAMLGSLGLVKIGIVLFSGLVIFQIITLPVEFDASARAKKALQSIGIVSSREEAQGVSAVLSAAAMTYVAATITAVVQLLYLVMRFGLLGGSRD